MAVQAYKPRCLIDLPKKKIDLTPYLGDGSQIATVKSLYAPTGRFSISFPDTPYRPGGVVDDTIYGIVEPMDRIEIRFARNGHEYPDGLPVVMRGFVRHVVRSESIGADGRPQRTVTVSGDDYGMFFEIAQLSVIGMKASGESPLSITWPAALGLNSTMLNAADAVKMVLDKLVNAQVKLMREATNDGGLVDIGFDGSVSAGSVHAFSLLQQEGTAWAKLVQSADTPWNELFLIDHPENGPRLVFRPTPWLDLDGKVIDNMGQVTDMTAVTDSFDFVLSSRYERSDAQVANVIWSACKAIALDNNTALASAIVNAASTPAVDFTEHPNSRMSIYGLRTLMRETQHYPFSDKPPLHNQAKVQLAANMSMVQWAEKRRNWLAAANLDNVLLDSGSLTIRGNEKLRPGVNYYVTRGQFNARHYITEISHHFAPYHSYTTDISFIRSDNFYLRNKGTGSSYLLEGRKGAY